MCRVLVFLIALLFGLYLPFVTTAAQAWELEVAGSLRWAYEWYQQRGSNGFFGPYNVDNGNSTTTANLNFWNGGQFDTNITTGADSGWSYLNVTFDPTIKINEAIKLKSRLRLAQYGNPLASKYITQSAPGSNNAFTEGQWTLFWATAQTPWGTIGIGKRPWEFGTALQYEGADAITTESMVLVVPYGPLEFGLAFYPYRFAGTSCITDLQGKPYYGDPFDVQIPQYFSKADRSGSLSRDFLAFLTYSSGPMEGGILGAYGAYHVGPEAPLGRAGTVAVDSEYFHGSAFLKFNNGRVFWNGEMAWLIWTDRYSNPSGTLASPNPRYVEQLRLVSESGIVSGPFRFSFLSAWTPGPDRRAGQLIGKQSAAFIWHPTFDTHLGNYSLFRPYSYLFAYSYGSGLNAYNLSHNGYVRDAMVLASRLDYAVAANVNLFGTVFYAQRNSRGYGWGCIGPNDLQFPPSNQPNNGNIQFNFNGVAGSPNIPDTALGYEIDAGFEWKLLEGWTVNALLGYWQPGRWFSYACIDRSVPNWNSPAAANFGTRPDRTIDPIIGGEFALNYQF